jgi:hypothetical protein
MEMVEVRPFTARRRGFISDETNDADKEGLEERKPDMRLLCKVILRKELKRLAPNYAVRLASRVSRLHADSGSEDAILRL